MTEFSILDEQSLYVVFLEHQTLVGGIKRVGDKQELQLQY